MPFVFACPKKVHPALLTSQPQVRVDERDAQLAGCGVTRRRAHGGGGGHEKSRGASATARVVFVCVKRAGHNRVLLRANRGACAHASGAHPLVHAAMDGVGALLKDLPARCVCVCVWRARVPASLLAPKNLHAARSTDAVPRVAPPSAATPAWPAAGAQAGTVNSEGGRPFLSLSHVINNHKQTHHHRRGAFADPAPGAVVAAPPVPYVCAHDTAPPGMCEGSGCVRCVCAWCGGAAACASSLLKNRPRLTSLHPSIHPKKKTKIKNSQNKQRARS